MARSGLLAALTTFLLLSTPVALSQTAAEGDAALEALDRESAKLKAVESLDAQPEAASLGAKATAPANETSSVSPEAVPATIPTFQSPEAETAANSNTQPSQAAPESPEAVTAGPATNANPQPGQTAPAAAWPPTMIDAVADPSAINANAQTTAPSAQPAINADAQATAPSGQPAANSDAPLNTALPAPANLTPAAVAGATDVNPPATPVSAEQVAAIEAELKQTVKAVVLQYFTAVRMPPPETVDVAATANLVNDANGTAARLSGVAIDVHLTSDHPASVIAEARNYTQRELDNRGYRFGAASDAADLRVPATLTFKADPPAAPTSWLAKRGLKPILVLAALGLATLGLLALALAMIVRLFRRRPSPKTPGSGPSDAGRSDPTVMSYAGPRTAPIVDFGPQSEILTKNAAHAAQMAAAARDAFAAKAAADARHELEREAALARAAVASREQLALPEEEVVAAIDEHASESALAAREQEAARSVAAHRVDPPSERRPQRSARDAVADLLRAGANKSAFETDAFPESIDDETNLPPEVEPADLLPDSLLDDPNLAVFGEPNNLRSGASVRDPEPLEKPRMVPNPELAELFARIEQLPLDQAMVVLASLSEAERDLLFDRLNINASVRRRVERELADLRLGTPQVERP